MKKRLHTSFVKFIVEKYDKEIQELPEEETNYRKDISDEYDEIMDYGDEENDEVQDEEEIQENDENPLSEMEKGAIEKALFKNSGNISKTAEELGLSRAALYRRMEKYDLKN